MTEAEWLACGDPELMLREGATRTSRKQRLCAVACCRRIANVMTDEGRRAVDAAEAFADSTITESELARARILINYPRAARRLHATDAARSASATIGYGCAVLTVVPALFASITSPRNYEKQSAAERAAQIALIRDIFGNPFRPVTFAPEWRTDTATAIARQMYESRDFSTMPILADALQDAGCDNDDVLNHCREPGEHVRGCWVCDLVLGKE